MPITRSADVARTAHDLTHINRLGVPELGVVFIQVRAGVGNRSKCYRDASSKTAVLAPIDGDDTFHFAPGPQYDQVAWVADPALKDDVQIVYQLHNPQVAIKTAKLEIFPRFADTPIWSRDLDEDERLQGEHTLQFNAQDNWDGKIDAHADYPDQFLTAEHSPYKVRLTITGDGVNTSPTAWTYLHVFVGKLELDYGPKTLLPVQPANLEGGLHTETYDDLIAQGAFPGAGANREVYLKSDIFTNGGGDMLGNQLYTRYETLWGKGPLIPVFCKIWVKSSADADVVAPKALGKLRFLWDWESTSAESATTFTQEAENYLKKKTKPKGLNCHNKRGGKRGGDKAVFPAQAGTVPGALPVNAFPFQVEEIDTKRKWASHSYAWNGGDAGSKTGAMFQPSRTAGDKYKITVYVNQVYDRKKKLKLDTDSTDPLPTPLVLKAESGNFHIWRRVHLRKYVKKSNAVAETITLATVIAFYKTAFLDLKDETGGAIVNVAEPDWNARITAYFNGRSAAMQHMERPGNQYTEGGGGVYLRNRTEYRAAFLLASGGVPGPVDTFMADPSNLMRSDKEYNENAEDTVGSPAALAAFSPEADPGSGCTIFHIDKIHNLPNGLLGYACDLPGGAGNRCGFMLCSTQADHGAGDNIQNTATHEFGHHFFLPHTTDAGEKKNYKAHDSSVTTCIMSYNSPTEFCGLCQLRLRGWDKSALKVKPSANKKT